MTRPREAAPLTPIQAQLMACRDPAYRAFHCKLIPTVDPETVLGVRTPQIRALAKELGPSGITVNCVAPGVIATEMNAALSPETLAALAEDTPLERLGTPEDVARAIWFLASPAGDFFTGQVLAPNGGFVI